MKRSIKLFFLSFAFGSRRFHFSTTLKAYPTKGKRRSIPPSADAMAIWLSMLKSMLNFTLLKKAVSFKVRSFFFSWPILWTEMTSHLRHVPANQK